MEKEMGSSSFSNPELRRKIVTTFYRRLYFVTRNLDKPVPLLRSRLLVENRLLLEKDFQEYHIFRPDQKQELVAARLRAGHHCHASWHQGRILDASWCATGRGPVPYFGRKLVIREGDVFIFDSYTHPSFRGFNLFMAKFAHIFRTYSELGYRRNIGVVAIENRTSMTVLKRLGCEAVGLYSSIGLGPVRIVRCNPYRDEPLPPMVFPWK